MNIRAVRSLAARPAWIAAVLVVILVAGALAVMFSPTIAQALFDRAARTRAATTNIAPLADDALRVAVCGSSAPLPSADRAKACVAVFAGGKFYVVDVGPESVENLTLWGVPLASIGGVLLTHFHSDHIGDLGELNLQTWAAGRRHCWCTGVQVSSALSRGSTTRIGSIRVIARRITPSG
jgi:ribonuclease Z